MRPKTIDYGLIRSPLYNCLTILPIMEHNLLTNRLSILIMNKISSIILASLVAAGWPAIAAEKLDFSKLDLSKLPPPASKKGLSYATDIRPMLETSCFRCHGQQRPKGDLELDSLEALLKGGKDGKVVIAGDSKKSLLLIAAAQIDDETAMPPKRGPGRGGPGGPGGFGGPGNPPPGGGNPPGPKGPGPSGGPPNGPGGPGGGGFGPPPKPLTAEQVGIIRAWIDQGAH